MMGHSSHGGATKLFMKLRKVKIPRFDGGRQETLNGDNSPDDSEPEGLNDDFPDVLQLPLGIAEEVLPFDGLETPQGFDVGAPDAHEREELTDDSLEELTSSPDDSWDPGI